MNPKHYHHVDIKPYLRNKKRIFDIGTGLEGSPWWNDVDTDAIIESIDLNFFPKKIPHHVSVYKYDADDLASLQSNTRVEKHGGWRFFKYQNVKWIESFDLVVANHVLEHVKSPQNVIRGIYRLLKKKWDCVPRFPGKYQFHRHFLSSDPSKRWRPYPALNERAGHNLVY